MQSCDVVLINPGNTRTVYQELANEFSAIEPPSLAALFATYLRKHNVKTAIVDMPIVGNSYATAAKAMDYHPLLIVLVVYGFQPSASTQNMPAAFDVCWWIRQLDKSGTKILFTGTHPAALPEQTLSEMFQPKIPYCDFVCTGEGPQTILKVFQALKNSSSLLDVPNLCFRIDGQVFIKSDSAPLIENLDEEMPYGAWDLLPMDKYRAHNWHCFDSLQKRQPYVSIHTSLGCPYKCSFCCINAPFGKPSYRMWSPKVVVEEIDRLKKTYGIRNIKFVDEMFVLNKEHVLGICDGLIDLGHDLNIWAYARVDTVREEFLEKLQKAGFKWLALGIESASKHVRDGVEKGRFGSSEILKTVRKIQDAGINVIGNYIFGLPDDTWTSMGETLDLAIEANCEFANFYSAMAYPGSKLYSLAIEKRWELPRSWSGYSQHGTDCLPLRTEKLSSAEVLKFRDEAFHAYFTNEKYLSLVKKKFGDDVVEHLGRMTKIKLRREIYN
jgi:radical SAM superfamily enzyme YgiQ (UPF0313 family)